MKPTRGTAQWIYRCSPEGTDPAATKVLLGEGFLWRGLHNVDGHKIANVQNIEVGDTLHVYVADETGADQYLSSWLIGRPTQPADPETPAVETVSEGELFERLDGGGYAQDSVLGCFTGFRVTKDDYASPPAKPRWVARNAIARVPKPA